MNSSFIGKEVVVFHKQRTYTNDSFVISANKNCTFSFCYFPDNGIIKLKNAVHLIILSSKHLYFQKYDDASDMVNIHTIDERCTRHDRQIISDYSSFLSLLVVRRKYDIQGRNLVCISTEAVLPKFTTRSADSEL